MRTKVSHKSVEQHFVHCLKIKKDTDQLNNDENNETYVYTANSYYNMVVYSINSVTTRLNEPWLSTLPIHSE